MASVDLKTGGMHCGSCAMNIEMSVGDLPGIETVKADASAGKTHVEYDPSSVDIDTIVATIVEAGYTAEVNK